MGNYRSGKRRTRYVGTVENAIQLDIVRLCRRGVIGAGPFASGTIEWLSDNRITDTVAFATYPIEPDAGLFGLRFAVGGEMRSQHIELVARGCNYGGRRYYFRCPILGHICRKLYCIDGYFASRQAHRLTYASKSDNTVWRLRRAIRKIDDRFSGANARPVPRGENRKALAEKRYALQIQSTQAVRQWLIQHGGL
jgi:hypothetical protein